MTNHEFSPTEVDSILKLAALSPSELTKKLGALEIQKVYDLFRRVLLFRMVIRPEDKIPVPIDQKVDLTEARRRHWEIFGLGKRLREYLLEAIRKEKLNPFKALQLFPNDPLINSKSSISSSCLLKALEFKEIDRVVDECFGIRIEEVHKAVMANPTYKVKFKGETLYLEIPPYFLNTSYVDFQSMIETVGLKPGETLVDIGCAIGRMGFFIGLNYPKSNYIGLEVVTERVKEADRVAKHWDFKNLEFVEQDLAEDGFKMPRADYYFAYDPVGGPTREKLFRQFKEYAKDKPFKLIAMQGNPGFFKYLEDVPWLKEVGTDKDWKYRIYAPK
jgi:hypothetical protein